MVHTSRSKASLLQTRWRSPAPKPQHALQPFNGSACAPRPLRPSTKGLPTWLDHITSTLPAIVTRIIVAPKTFANWLDQCVCESCPNLLPLNVHQKEETNCSQAILPISVCFWSRETGVSSKRSNTLVVQIGTGRRFL
jgi:hypothetical protein